MKQTVLITGASGGIGRNLADVFAEKGFDLVLTARSADKLNAAKDEIEKNCGVTVRVFAYDLTLPDAAEKLVAYTDSEGVTVDILVNNAGFGDYGAFLSSDLNKQTDMINLNITALTRLTYFYGGKMKKRDSGRILNICSLAAFSPGPYMSVYYATKAYVLSFSQAVATELKRTKVTVTAICIGPTDSGFTAAAGMEKCNLFNAIKPVSALTVAKAAYKAVMSGKPLKYYGFPTRILSFGTRFSPYFLIRKTTEGINGIPFEG